MFALSQSVIHNGLPHGVEVAAEANTFGALLEPRIYRDVKVSCMYLVEDVQEMLVPSLEVPVFEPPIVREAEENANQSFITPKKGRTFKPERKSDFSTGAYESTIKKVRQGEEFPEAKAKVDQMLGSDEEDDTFLHKETLYILKCLDTECTSSSLYAGLVHYKSVSINAILRDDFNYCGDEVLKNKANLLLVCKAFLGNLKISTI